LEIVQRSNSFKEEESKDMYCDDKRVSIYFWNGKMIHKRGIQSVMESEGAFVNTA